MGPAPFVEKTTFAPTILQCQLCHRQSHHTYWLISGSLLVLLLYSYILVKIHYYLHCWKFMILRYLIVFVFQLYFFKDYLCYSQTFELSCIFIRKVVKFHKEIFHDFNWDGFENIDQFGRSLYLCSMLSLIYYLGVWLHSLASLSVFQIWWFFLEILHVFCYIYSWVLDVLMLCLSS